MQRPLAQENWLGGQVRARDRVGAIVHSSVPLSISSSFLPSSAYQEVFPRVSKPFLLEKLKTICT